MLRAFFVIAIVVIGLRYSFKHPFYALLFYLWLAYFRPEQWLWWDFLSPLHLSTILGAWLVISTLLSSERLKLGLGPLLLWAFLAQCLISTLLSPVVGASWDYFEEFAKVIAVAYLMTVLITTEARLRQTMLVIGLSLGLEGAKEGWHELILHPGGKNVNPWPMLGDNNGVAVGMLMLSALLICLATTSRYKWEKRALGFMSVGTIYRALSTYSRGGFLSCLALGLHHLAESKKRFRAILAVLVVAAVIAPALPDAFWDRMNTIRTGTDTNGEVDESAAGRFHFWAVATSMAKDRPMLGVGQNAYNRAYDAYDTSYGLYGFGRSVHSSWFGVLAELGLPGLLLFVLLFVNAFRTTIRVRRLARGDPQLTTLATYGTAIEAGLLVFVVGGAFLPMQYNEMVWHFLALSMTVGRLAGPDLAATTVPEVRIATSASPARSTTAVWKSRPIP